MQVEINIAAPTRPRWNINITAMVVVVVVVVVVIVVVVIVVVVVVVVDFVVVIACCCYHRWVVSVGAKPVALQGKSPCL